MNYFLRELGGCWSWADLERDGIAEMSLLLGEHVHYVSEENLPFDDESFDRVVSIDVHEHLNDPEKITRELCRVAKKGAQIHITVPNGDESKIAVRVKHALNMTKETYGHKRVGFTVSQLKELMTACQIEPVADSTYSRFFTEMLELSINFVYVKILNKHNDDDKAHGEIAPATKEKLEAVSNSYRLYSVVFPIYWLISKLDYLLVGQEGYCVLISGRRSES